jgi:hypothetical protein
VTRDEVVCYVDERVLDDMNTDAAVLFGPAGPREVEAREHNKAAWVRAQIDAVRARAGARGALLAAPVTTTASP